MYDASRLDHDIAASGSFTGRLVRYAGTHALAESLARDRQELEATFARLEALDPEDKTFQGHVELLGGQARQLTTREEHELFPLAERSIPEGHVEPVAERHESEHR